MAHSHEHGTAGPAQFDSDLSNPHSKRYDALIVGWRPGKYLIMEFKASAAERTQFITNHQCAVRFLRDGKPCAMRVQVLDERVECGSRLFCTTWPDEIQFRTVRSQERFQFRCPSAVTRSDGTVIAGEIQDLSVSGCRMLSEQALQKGEVADCMITLPNGEEVRGLTIEVRHSARATKGHSAGCQFLNPDSAAIARIHFYLALLKESEFARAAAPHKRILALENVPERLAVLREALEAQGLELFVAGDAVKAIAWIALRKPERILVNSGAAELLGTEFCRIVRRVVSRESVPIYLYDAGGAPARNLLQSTGADAVIEDIWQAESTLETLGLAPKPPNPA